LQATAIASKSKCAVFVEEQFGLPGLDESLSAYLIIKAGTVLA